jgi:hypothetical protein
MPLSLTAAERSLRARAAAHALHAQGGTSTKAGTAAFLARFERQVDPAGTLAPDERARRAEHALKAHMSALALKASRARSKNKKTTAALGRPAVVTPEVRRVGRAVSD